MARICVSSDLAGNAGHVPDVVSSVSTATVAANIATLVADGASPTQAHVNTLNTNWTTLLAGLGTVPAGLPHVVMSIDTTAISTRSKLRTVLNNILQQFESGVGALKS